MKPRQSCVAVALVSLTLGAVPCSAEENGKAREVGLTVATLSGMRQGHSYDYYDYYDDSSHTVWTLTLPGNALLGVADRDCTPASVSRTRSAWSRSLGSSTTARTTRSCF